MIRVVVAVLLGLALLAASVPAVEDAGAERSDAAVRASIADLDDAATDLARQEELAPDVPGPRRTVAVELPSDDLASAPVASVRIDPTNRTYGYRVAGGPEQRIPARAPIATADGEALVLTGAGQHRLVLELTARDGERRVVVRRAEHSRRSGGQASRTG